MGARQVLKCVEKVIPCILESGLIVNLNYPLTFLEFYEIILNCLDVLFRVLRKQRIKEGTKYAQETIDSILDFIFGPRTKSDISVSYQFDKKKLIKKASLRSSKKHIRADGSHKSSMKLNK